MPTLTELIKKADRIVLTSHLHPDGDSISSLLSLTLSLQQLGKQVTPVLTEPVPAVFNFLEGVPLLNSSFPPLEEIDLIITLDVNDISRTGLAEPLTRLSNQSKLAIIDHHPKGDLARLSHAALRDESVSSTCELVYQLILDLEVRITPSIATAILTGIFTDTGGFHYMSTSNRTLEIAAELMRRGGRLHSIARSISYSKSLAGVKLLGIALSRLYLSQAGKVAVSVLTHQDILENKAKPEDLTGIISNLNTLPGVKMYILLIETEPGIIRGSLRTESIAKINVNSLAKLLRGGGHPYASGFVFSGRLKQQSNYWKVIAETVKKR